MRVSLPGIRARGPILGRFSSAGGQGVRYGGDPFGPLPRGLQGVGCVPELTPGRVTSRGNARYTI